MPEASSFPATPAGDALRHLIAARRVQDRRLKLLALIAFAVSLEAATIVWKPPCLFVWNASASAPIGLYKVEPATAVRRGDMVVAWAPSPARSLAARRHYLPANVPLVKRVEAVRGDEVCALDDAISVNGRRTTTRLRRDPTGRLMPWWNGCRGLGDDEYFLLGNNPLSFDGRYFGTTAKADLIGRALLLWAKPVKGQRNG